MSVIHFPTITIQPLTADDLSAASQLLYTVWHQTYDQHLPDHWISEHDLDHFNNYLDKKQSRCWLAR